MTTEKQIKVYKIKKLVVEEWEMEVFGTSIGNAIMNCEDGFDLGGEGDQKFMQILDATEDRVATKAELKHYAWAKERIDGQE